MQQNKVFIPKELEELATYFDEPLYVVGGYVRDSLLDFQPSDIDLTSSCSPERVFELLKNSPYSVCTTSLKMMTLKISIANFSYEYTSFRVDTYTKGHSPSVVKLTDDIHLDALRRDFTVNALYYDIKNKCVVDLLGGLEDLEKRQLVTVTDAKKVFSEDGLRIMRLARFSAETGFCVEENTFLGAKKFVNLIQDIAEERIRVELDKILVADTIHNNIDGQVKGMELLRELGVLDIILPELMEGFGMKQRADYHKYDVYYHSLNTLRHADSSIRLFALLHDIGKPYCYNTTNKFACHDVEGAKIAKKFLEKLKYPTNTINLAVRLIQTHMFDLNGEAKENTVRKFLVKNIDIIDKVFLLKQADYVGGGLVDDECPTVIKLNYIYKKMLEEKVPFSIKELFINGQDLININIPPQLRAKTLQAVLENSVIDNGKNNTRERQLIYAKTTGGK